MDLRLWIGTALCCSTRISVPVLKNGLRDLGQLSARSIVLLDDCIRTITFDFKLLDGEGQYSFGQWKQAWKADFT